MDIRLKALAFVKNIRREPIDDRWAAIIAEIELSDDVPSEAFDRITDYSHLEIIYYFDKVKEEDIIYCGVPRGNPDYPALGIFAQRKKDRPNRIGLATVELISHQGRAITVRYLDAIDGTPVLDIKPVIREFEPKTEIRQPGWISTMMKNYWQ